MKKPTKQQIKGEIRRLQARRDSARRPLKQCKLDIALSVLSGETGNRELDRAFQVLLAAQQVLGWKKGFIKSAWKA